MNIEKRKVLLIITDIVAIALGIMLAIPMFVGCFSITTQANIGTTNNAVWDPIRSFQLAFVATALGGVTLWFASRKDAYRDINIVSSADQWEYRSISAAGRCLLISAACFSILGILSPLLPEAIANPNFWNDFIKHVSLAVTMLGSIFLAMALTSILVSAWVWKIH